MYVLYMYISTTTNSCRFPIAISKNGLLNIELQFSNLDQKR